MANNKVLLIDKLISEGWFSDEKEATAWIMDRKVLVDEQPVFSAKQKVRTESIIRIKEYYKTKYVNKGGYKLEGALKQLGIDVNGKIALDCGASTGGFTDCLLQHGAGMVYAVDVGYGQIAGKLAVDPRVVNLEKTNINSEQLLHLNPKPDMITLDLSYLSLRKAVPICKEILHGCGTIVALIKPLFEVDSSEIRRTGVMNDYDTLYQCITELCSFFVKKRMRIFGITYSPIRGNNGTTEYFIHLSCENNENRTNRTDGSLEQQIHDIIVHSLSIEKFVKK